MKFFLFAILPLILISAVPTLQLKLISLKNKDKINLSIGAITLISFLAGIIFSILSPFISMMGLSPDIRCATGCFGFLGLGFLITLILVPIIGIFSYVSYLKKHKNTIAIENTK